MAYRLGPSSLAALDGVHPDLVRVVQRAIGITRQDFTVTEGLRTPERQRALVADGKSRTLNSMHIRQPDGYGHAVDLVPYVDGRPVWDMARCQVLAEAMREAAQELGVGIRWGCAWDVDLRATSGKGADVMGAYARRHAGSDFLDGPHYELREA